MLSVTKFKTLEEAIEIGNDTIYGLGAGVWSRNGTNAYRVGREIKAGRVWTNCYHLYPAHAAFGGYKASGFGRETHKMILDHYQQTKNLLVSYSPNALGFFDHDKAEDSYVRLPRLTAAIRRFISEAPDRRSRSAANAVAMPIWKKRRDAMPDRVVFTAAAAALVRSLEAAHGLLIFHLSGGCCEGSAPMCFRRGDFRSAPRTFCSARSRIALFTSAPPNSIIGPTASSPST